MSDEISTAPPFEPSGVKTTITAKDGKVTIYREQDVEAIIKANKAALNAAPTWRPYSGGSRLRFVADIPVTVVEQWMKEGINMLSPDPDMQRAWRRKLDDYTNRDLRTFPGRLGVRAKHF